MPHMYQTALAMTGQGQCHAGPGPEELAPLKREAQGELGLGPKTADFRAAITRPFLHITYQGWGQSQLLATCVPTSVSLHVLGISRPCLQPSSPETWPLKASVSPL